jgi:hypothetical protein
VTYDNPNFDTRLKFDIPEIFSDASCISAGYKLAFGQRLYPLSGSAASQDAPTKLSPRQSHQVHVGNPLLRNVCHRVPGLDVLPSPAIQCSEPGRVDGKICTGAHVNRIRLWLRAVRSCYGGAVHLLLLDAQLMSVSGLGPQCTPWISGFYLLRRRAGSERLLRGQCAAIFEDRKLFPGSLIAHRRRHACECPDSFRQLCLHTPSS